MIYKANKENLFLMMLDQFLCSPCKWEITLPSGGGVVSCREGLNYGHLMPDRELLTYFSSVSLHTSQPAHIPHTLQASLTHLLAQPSPGCIISFALAKLNDLAS